MSAAVSTADATGSWNNAVQSYRQAKERRVTSSGATTFLGSSSGAGGALELQSLRADLLQLFNRIIEVHNQTVEFREASEDGGGDSRFSSPAVGGGGGSQGCNSPSRKPHVKIIAGDSMGSPNKLAATLGEATLAPPAQPGSNPLLLDSGGSSAWQKPTMPLSPCTKGPIPLLSSLDPERLSRALSKMCLDELPLVVLEVVELVLHHTTAVIPVPPPLQQQQPPLTLQPSGGFVGPGFLAPSALSVLTPQLPLPKRSSFAFDPTSNLQSPMAPLRSPAIGSSSVGVLPPLSPPMSQHLYLMHPSRLPLTLTEVPPTSTPSSMEASLSSYRPTPKFTQRAVHETDAEGFTTLNNYVLLEQAGAGRFGKVCVANVIGTTELRAIKIVPKARLRRRWHQLREFPNSDAPVEVRDPSLQREVAIMKRLRHRNIVPLYEVIDDPDENNLYMVMKYVEKGPIVKLDDLWGCPPVDIDLVRCLIRQCASGVAYLHRHHIAHRDIKPDNILLGADGTVYLSDFGVSFIFDTNDHVCNSDGTPAYAAPEVVRGEGDYSATKADIWALGVTMYTLVFGEAPFYSPSILNLNEQIVNKPIVFEVNAKMDGDTDYSDAFDLLGKMLNRDPIQRATAKDVCKHPFLTRGQLHRKGSDPDPLPVAAIEPTEEELQSSFTPLIARPPQLSPRSRAAYRREWVSFESHGDSRERLV